MTERDVIVQRLATIADELETLSARIDQLYADRLALWLGGRALEPSMRQRELALPSRVTEGAVTQALRKHNQRKEVT